MLKIWEIREGQGMQGLIRVLLNQELNDIVNGEDASLNLLIILKKINQQKMSSLVVAG